MNALIDDHPNIEFIKEDVRLHETLEEVINRIKKSCDVLSVDLGGGTPPLKSFSYDHQL